MTSFARKQHAIIAVFEFSKSSIGWKALSIIGLLLTTLRVLYQIGVYYKDFLLLFCKGNTENLVKVGDKVELEFAFDVVGDFNCVFFVGNGSYNCFDASSVSSDGFFFEPTNFQDSSS